MTPSPYPVHHIGIAVRDLEASVREYSSRWSFVRDFDETLPAQKVQLAFLRAGSTLIELLTPLDSSSTLARFLEKRGEGLHHICYEVKDIVAELTRLRSLGVELIDQAPRPGAHGSQIAFLHPKSCGGVLTELCQPRR